MPRPTRIEFPGALNYISIHSVPGVKVFKDKIDNTRFLQILNNGIRRYKLKLHAYVLLNDGYRFLLETPMANLTKSIQYINSHYMAYLNTRHGSAGRIFTGRYRSAIVEKQVYIAELCRHIHILPVHAGLVAKPEQYPWSSYSGYLRQDSEALTLYIKDVMEKFGGVTQQGKHKFQQFVDSGLKEDSASLETQLRKSRIIGSSEFVVWVHKQTKLEAPREIDTRLIVGETARYHDVDEKSITNNRTKPNMPRNVAIYLCRNITSTPLDKLGKLFDVGPSSVCNTAKRVEAHRSSDRELQKALLDIERLVKKKQSDLT